MKKFFEWIIAGIKWIFSETDKSFSVRKFLAVFIGLVFVFAVVWFKIHNKTQELPTSYVLIISGVFGFYFLKNTLSNVKLTSKTDK